MAPPRGDAWSGLAQGWGTAWAVMATMISGPVAWGGIGLLLDLWLDFKWLFLPIGMVVGMAGSIYLVIRRYGTEQHED